MTQDEITALAGHRIVSPWVMKLAMDVARAEREACAKRAHVALLGTLQTTADRVIKAIMTRGQ